MHHDTLTGLDTTALRELIESSGVRFKNGKISWIFTCPRCLKKEKLWIRKSDGRFVCWVCKERTNFYGQPEFALRELFELTLADLRHRLYGDGQQAVAELALNLRDWFGEDEPLPDDLPIVPLPAMLWGPDQYPIDHAFSVNGAAYLTGRGISVELALQYGVRYCPPRRRVVFPVEVAGRLLGWQERTIDPHEWIDEETGETVRVPKATTVTGLRKEQTLMFLDRLTGADHCVLTEGPIDAIKAHLCGGNVAALGKGVSAAQIALIRNAGIRRLYLALDPDAAKTTERLVREHCDDLELYQIVPPPGYEDLGAAPLDGVLEAFRRARRVAPGNVFLFLRNPVRA